jgi:predicted dehydrogenase
MHLPSLASHPCARLMAICGRNHERASRLAAKYAIPRVYTDYRLLLAQEGLDAVVIATPDHTHCELVMAVLDAGLHVLCEKPLALNACEARAMAERAEQIGVKHMVAFAWRWLPHYRYLYQLVRDGYIGRCFHAYFSYLTGGGRGATYSWRYDRRYSTGALGNLGAHMIDLARLFLGDVVCVSSRSGVFVERPGPDNRPLDAACDAFIVSLACDSGVHAILQVGEVFQMGERYQEQRVYLHGERGTLEAELSLTGTNLARQEVRLESKIRGVRCGQPGFELLPLPNEFLLPNVQPVSLLDPFLQQPIGARLFIDAILDPRLALPSFWDGLAVQEIMDAALISAQTGSRASLTSTTPQRLMN